MLLISWDCQKKLICLELETADGDPYCRLTVSFGEFVGMYGALFVDVDNVPNAESFLVDNQIAFPTGAFKASGYVTYPCYQISPYAMEALFTTDEIFEYHLDYDFYNDMQGILEEETRNVLNNNKEVTKEEAVKIAKANYVKDFLQKEKESFDNYLKDR